MDYYLNEIHKITTGKKQLENRIDGQFIGNRNNLLSFIEKNFQQKILIINDIYEKPIDEYLKQKADKIVKNYYFYQSLSGNLIKNLKKSKYIQGLYIFHENECILQAEDNLEDITITLNIC